MLQDCGAVATDSTGADISSSIVVVDVTPCAAGAQCPACAITFAAAGLCQPGPYLYLYRSANCTHLLSYRIIDMVHTQQGTMPVLSLSVALHLISIHLVRCPEGLAMAVADQTADVMLDGSTISLTCGASHTGFYHADCTQSDCHLSECAGPRTAMPRWHQHGGWCRCSSSMLSPSPCPSLSRLQT